MRAVLPDDFQSKLGVDLYDHLRLGPDSRGQIETPDGTTRVPARKRLIPAIFCKLREGSAEDVMKDLGVSVDDQVREGQDPAAGRVDHAETFDAVPDVVQRPQRMEAPVQNPDVCDTRLASCRGPLLDLRFLVGDRSHAGGGAGQKNQTRGGKGGLGKILHT